MFKQFQATQMKSKQTGDKPRLQDKGSSPPTLPLPSLADPLTLGSGGMFDGHAFNRLIASTFGEDNYLKVMMVSY